MKPIHKTLRIFYLLIAIPIFSSYCQDFNNLSYGYSQKVKAARVIDGDTFVLSDSQRVRILGIDCPEIAKPGKPSQPFGDEAKQKTKNLIEGKTIKLTFEKEAGYHDFFGRLSPMFGSSGPTTKIPFSYKQNSSKPDLLKSATIVNKNAIMESLKISNVLPRKIK